MAEDARAVILFIHGVDATIAYADSVGLETCADQQVLADQLNGVAGTTQTMQSAVTSDGRLMYQHGCLN
jgi:hypothetical protein